MVMTRITTGDDKRIYYYELPQFLSFYNFLDICYYHHQAMDDSLELANLFEVTINM